MAMTPAHKLRLLQNRVKLVEEVEVTPVVIFLMQEKVLVGRMAEDVMHYPVRQDKVSALLDLIPRRGDQAGFRNFMQHWDMLNKPWLADRLEN